MKFWICVLLSFFSSSLFGVSNSGSSWQEGSIVLNGTIEKGMIRLAGDVSTPWLNHWKVYFVSVGDFPSDFRPKNKVIQEYKPKDIDAYWLDSKHETPQHGWVYSTEEVKIVKGLGKKNTKVFLRQVAKGAINVYSYIPKPDDDSAKEREYAYSHSTTYFRKGEGVLCSAVECDMSELLSECPEVVNKLKSGDLGYEDVETRPKRKGLGKVFADNAGDNELERLIISSVFEYNKCIN